MNNTVLGVDVSSWQHENNLPIDWWAVYVKGYRFCVIKATQGTSYCNPWIVRDIGDANAAGLLVGAYHYFEPGEDPAAQAKWAVSNLVMQQLDLGLFLDWECYLPAKYVHTQELTTFLAEARLTRPQCGVYCDEFWAAQLQEESVNIGRLWVAGREGPPSFACFAYQAEAVKDVPGIPGRVNVDHIVNTRGVDIPTSPVVRPPVEPLYTLAEVEEIEATQVDDEHNPTDDSRS